ncbi:esterase-like activity of phytase family protein [Sinorhizobium meliloti]|uniref:esterase-like activity of phytase family protein n=2 Tax=Rhizobium meliloti TaxID=382 RepID=UPI000FD5375A|nr:esterase-like activity of phytase family protein [Sinorhizobium meliloti]MDW9479257.1 alkaline phosphatase [Sinorhizobium meliloti]MDW9669748.1 alkaline phosphatase [Sinorhizobium meliloti]MQV23877.1 alkaline phosphatase [Sinorhizobium meliloti]MQW12725.1 alkaline phosphatase [Sinorhizobium meliloti]RVM11097.1 esterase-like activity of phytase family protein [Sinorhizobium meliloti]
MKAFSITTALAAALAASTASVVQAEQVFNRIASFAVATNLPEGAERNAPTSAEIITASEDGNTLIYSDSPGKRIGFIDITDAKAPEAGGIVSFSGEPTSVAVAGAKALVAVNTSESFTKPSGVLAVVDIAGRKVDATCDLGGQPDSVAVNKDRTLAAIAIENERDEDVNDGQIPQMPAGDLVILSLKDGAADCATIKHVTLTGLAEVAGDDPEPEFVAFNGRDEIALTLQENNHIVIIDGKSATVKTHFPAGTVDLEAIDTKRDGSIAFTGEQAGRKREPDAIKWLDDDRLVVANEGDYEGGSRGFTIFDTTGKVLYESGAGFERAIASIGHYPEKRSSAKGVEPEGLEMAQFGEDKLFFVLSERASIVGVYKDTGGEPELVQLLPSGVSPEGAVAIPGRNLFATANEVDLVEDGGARSHVMIYERGEGEAAYPQIRSAEKDGLPIGFGALSGLAAADKPGFLHAVNDSVFSSQPTIFTIDATQKPALITEALPITRDGAPAQKLDIEGIANDGEGGFWLASEGNSDKLYSHALLHVNKKGEIKQEIALPEELRANEIRYGFEGVAVVGEGDDQVLWMAVQREWKDDEKGFVKLVSYKPSSKEWGAVRYPLEKSEEGWVGLSEISVHGDYAYIVERDNLIGEAAKLKKLYRVALADLKPAALGGELPVVNKEEVRDLIPDLQSLNGYVVDKVEGFAVDAAGNGYVVTDNDGVDDSSGETLFFSIGAMDAM